jgi:hypothetical protein
MLSMKPLQISLAFSTQASAFHFSSQNLCLVISDCLALLLSSWNCNCKSSCFLCSGVCCGVMAGSIVVGTAAHGPVSGATGSATGGATGQTRHHGRTALLGSSFLPSPKNLLSKSVIAIMFLSSE